MSEGATVHEVYVGGPYRRTQTRGARVIYQAACRSCTWCGARRYKEENARRDAEKHEAAMNDLVEDYQQSEFYAESLKVCPWRDTDHLGERLHNYCTWCDGFVAGAAAHA